MINNKIVILHVFIDGMHFHKAADTYDSLPNVENLYYFYAPSADFVFSKIKDSRVKFIYDFNEYLSYFSNPNIDVILFQSLPYHYYYLFDYIDDSKFVVWWMWGYDIYNGQGEYSALIPEMELYKPLTKSFMEQMINMSNGSLSGRIRRKTSWLIRLPLRVVGKLLRINRKMPQILKARKTQDEILARIDAAYAPLDADFTRLKESHPCFHAELFPHPIKAIDIPVVLKKKAGNILVNHSLTYTVNHLDVFHVLRQTQISDGRKFIVPVSYGIFGYNGKPEILEQASNMDPEKTMWLTKVLPYDEYKALLGTVTHAVFGMLRQQGMWNVNMCLITGVKIYLFKDSVVYKELKGNGYVCYSIEDDLTTDSLSSCLDEKDALHNYHVYMKRCQDHSLENCIHFLESGIDKKKNH